MRTIPKSLWIPILIGMNLAPTAIAQNTFPPSGNVGVGTSNPQTTLHLKDSGGHSCAAQLRLDLQIAGHTNGCGPASSLWDISSLGSNTLTFTSIGTPVLTLTGPGRVGINTATPKANFDIAGNVRIVDGTQGANKVLTSDTTGLASWQALPGAGIGGSGPPTALAKFTGATTVGGSQISDDGSNIVVSSLSFSGSGTRMVVANQNGKLSTQVIAPPPAGDNLGNHRATITLDLQSRDIVDVWDLKFDRDPSFLSQTSASPWVYHNLPSGYKADHRFLMGSGNIDSIYKLKIEGDAYITGVWNPSDAALKGNSAPIVNPIRKLEGVRGVTYDLRPDPTTPPYRTVGLVAQEVRAVLPEAVRESSDGQLALNYNGVVALLVEAVKEQQATIRTQQTRIDELERRLRRLERSPTKRR